MTERQSVVVAEHSIRVKYIVWVREGGRWVEQGDGPLPPKTAERIAREIRIDCRVPTRVLPVGVEPV